MVCAVHQFRSHDRNLGCLVRACGCLEVPGAYFPYRFFCVLIALQCLGKSTCEESGGSMDQIRRTVCPFLWSRSRLESDRPWVVQGCHRTCQECRTDIHH